MQNKQKQTNQTIVVELFFNVLRLYINQFAGTVILFGCFYILGKEK